MADTTHPTFTLTIGSVVATTDRPMAGPTRLVLERDMDIAADGLRVHLSDRSGIGLDDPVGLELGYGGSESAVFTGTVARLRPATGGVEVWALGGLHLLLDLHCGEVYQEQSAGAIAHDLFGRAGLSAGTVDDGPDISRFAVDVRSSGYVHLAGLAQRLGYELYADIAGKAMFHALGATAGLDSGGGGFGAVVGASAPVPGDVAAAGRGGEVRYGSDLLGLDATDAPVIWESVDVGGESPVSGQGEKTASWLTTRDADYRGSSGSGGRHLLVIDPAARTKDLADRFAAGRRAAGARRAHEVRISVLGRPGVDLGDTLSVADHPDALANGSGYVRALRHRVGEGVGFVTDIRLALEPAA
ncbi:MAG: hypothetical protein QOE44_2345 [Solirubrobacteraceae bacterium]|jgi:hypothetical protein|nr:hypothetical protein [Solirubrobacteraceae bacterium]